MRPPVTDSLNPISKVESFGDPCPGVTNKVGHYTQSAVGLPKKTVPIRQGESYELLSNCLRIADEKIRLVRRHGKNLDGGLRRERSNHSAAQNQVGADPVVHIGIAHRIGARIAGAPG